MKKRRFEDVGLSTTGAAVPGLVLIKVLQAATTAKRSWPGQAWP